MLSDILNFVLEPPRREVTPGAAAEGIVSSKTTTARSMHIHQYLHAVCWNNVYTSVFPRNVLRERDGFTDEIMFLLNYIPLTTSKRISDKREEPTLLQGAGEKTGYT